MSELGRPFLHPDLRRLIDADRHAVDPPDTVKRSVAERVDRSLELGGAMLAPMPGLGLRPPQLTDAATPSVPPPPATIFGWKAVAGGLIAVVIGGAVALSLHARGPAPMAASGSADRIAARLATPLPAPPAGGTGARLGANANPEAPGAAGTEPGSAAAQPLARGALHAAETSGGARAGSRRRAAPSRASSSIDTLSAERIVLDGARAALVRRDARGALSALRSHEQSFPRGQLLEERESMRVQALALARDFAAMHAAGDRFLRHFPRSMFLPAVEQALETSP